MKVNRTFFYNHLRDVKFAGGKVTLQVFKGCEYIFEEWERRGLTDKRWLAYMLATAYHETGHTMLPVEEYGKGAGRTYGKHIRQSGKPYDASMPLYYGRGLVQLTWYENYEFFGKKLGLDLLRHPELALKSDVSVKIMFEGMIHGYFTGVALEQYFDSNRAGWKEARKIINGLDCADLIAGYALTFYDALNYAAEN